MGLITLMLIGLLPSVKHALYDTNLSMCGLDAWMKRNTSHAFRNVLKGGNYGREDKSLKGMKYVDSEADFNQVFGGWAATHVALYWILAFCAPKLWFPLFLIGVLWEILESFVHLHSVADILWNSIGIAAGILSRQLYDDVTGRSKIK